MRNKCVLFKSLSLGNPVIQYSKLTQMGLNFFFSKALFSFMFLLLYIIRLRYSLFSKHAWNFFFFFFFASSMLWSSFYLRKPTTSISMCMVLTFFEAQIPWISFRFSLLIALKQAPSPLTASTSFGPSHSWDYSLPSAWLMQAFCQPLEGRASMICYPLGTGPCIEKGLTSNCWINVRKHVPPF